MKEKDFQRWVIECARALGWKVWHVPAPMQWDSTGKGRGFVGAKDAAGLADLILMHIGQRRLVFAEIKGTGGKPSQKQVEFLESVTALGLAHSVRSFLWRPGDEEEVERVLARPEA